MKNTKNASEIVKNSKHLQGICNNLMMSLTEHPENYFRFWSHLYQPKINIDLKLNLLGDNDYPKYLTGEACSDINSTIIEYRGFFLNHLDNYKIDEEEITEANILIKTDRKKAKMIIFEAKFVVKTKDGKKYEASTTPTFWGNDI